MDFRNRLAGVLDAPVFDDDGVTPLAGDASLAQLYAGPAPEGLRPVGDAVPFRTGAASGYVDTGSGSSRSIPTVPAGAISYAQVRAWERAHGSSYEAAVASGGKAGTSAVLAVKTGNEGAPPSFTALPVRLETFRLEKSPPPPPVVLAGLALHVAQFGFKSAPPLAPIRLSAPLRLAPGRFALTVSAGDALDGVVEISTDLRAWRPLARLSSAREPLRLIDETASAGQPQRFYRARRVY